ncbi:hypothetical protein OROMI_013577 [Orobanche minor]
MAAEAAVSSAVQILGDLLIQKVRFLRGVAGEVTWLKDELKRMQGFLKDASDKESEEERVRIWISEIKEVAEDAQDAVELFLLKVESRGFVQRYTSFTTNKVGKEIERIRARLEAIDRSRLRYAILDLGEVPARRPPENVERRRRFIPDKDVVGLEGDVEWLLREAILGESKGMSIAAVVGMGGIGKSTLARMVYNRARGFECRAWVVVSSEFTPEDIVKQVMLQISLSDDDRLKVLDTAQKLEAALKDKVTRQEMLKEMLRRQLEGRRYFIVLDDVWEHAHWEHLRTAFPDEQDGGQTDKSSRLLFTSRNKVFTKYAQHVHDMKLLNPDRSWELFLKKAFTGNSTDGKCPKDFELIGRKILDKCGGLPLAISVVGGLLVEQSLSKSGWEKILKGINFHLSNGKSSVSAILELSYQNLPAPLKSCFLCLGFFKEDATIPVEKLIHIWVAEGLVPQEGEETMEEIARGYLDELINRNMVQVKDMTISNWSKNLHMHDLLRELSITKAKEEISFEIMREEGSSRCSSKPRHRAMYCSEGCWSNGSNGHLRSLFVHGDVDVAMPSSYWKSFELLRVLDLEGCFLSRFPDTICSLVGLRYLGLRGTGIRKLSCSLGKLKDLLVLDLRGLRLVKMPNYFIWGMQSLRHLYMPGIWCASPLNISNLKDLQTLSYIYWRDANTEQVTQMASLCKLGIDMDEVSDPRELFTSLAMLENLVCLKLRRYICLDMDDGLGYLDRITQLKLVASVRLPGVGNFPPNLLYLSLVWTALDEDPMPVLEKLPELVYLKIDRAYHGKEFVISSDGFPKLEAFSLRSLQLLRNIRVGEKGGMKELKQFEIHDCRKLITGDLPDRLRSTVALIN